MFESIYELTYIEGREAMGVGTTEQFLIMAAVALVSIPLFLVFVFLRKYIMSGVSRSGIKG